MERFPEPFTQLWSSGEQIPKLFWHKSNCLDRGFGFDRDDRWSPCKQIDIAGEIPRAVANEHHAFARGDVDGSYRSRKHYVAVERIVPGGDECIVFSNGASFPERCNLLKLGRIEVRIRYRVRERVESKSKRILRLIFPWEL